MAVGTTSLVLKFPLFGLSWAPENVGGFQHRAAENLPSPDIKQLSKSAGGSQTIEDLPSPDIKQLSKSVNQSL